MSVEEFNKYDKRCDVIKNIILKDYKDISFDFVRNPDTLIVEIIINKAVKISILPNNTLKDIKRHIDKKISNQHNGVSEDCIMCCEKIQNNVTCSKCSNNYCSECYINLFKIGKGIIKCPHCRFEIGEIMPDYMIPICIEDIRFKIELRKSQKF